MYTAVKPLSKYLQLKSVRIYDGIFILHSKCTCALLVAFTLLLSSKQYFGDPLVCMSDFKDKEFLNSHCWIMGTYIFNNNETTLDLLDEHMAKSRFKESSFRSDIVLLDNKYSSDRIYQHYYQWVVPVLLLQSFIFYLPAFLWKIREGGRLKQLCANLDNVLDSQEKRKTLLLKLVHYLNRDHKETHQRYFISYICCEVCNFLISIINMLLLNVFLNGFWSKYVHTLGALPNCSWHEWNRLTARIFPKMAKCEIMQYGSSGTQTLWDALCLLPLNNLNEKIFLFLWLWFVVMAILAGLKLIYRLLIIFNRGLRLQLLRAQSRYMTKSAVKNVLNGYSCSDWFILMRVSNNISAELFSLLLQLLNKKQFSTSSKSNSQDLNAV